MQSNGPQKFCERSISAGPESSPEKVLLRRKGVLECARFFEEGKLASFKNVSCNFGDVTQLVRG